MVRGELSKGGLRHGFRVVHFSVQTDHLHLLCEAEDRQTLSRGLQGLFIRIARAVNRELGRKGTVFADRYHDRILRSAPEVRNALAYVLLNVRKHDRERVGSAPPVRLDEASSGRWFDGWKRPPPVPNRSPTSRTAGVRDVAPARFLLTRRLWRRWGLVDPREVPGSAPA